ncbi:MAG: radical SAM protein, partial [Candidatus Nanoarchaeia archaeon]
MKENVRKVLEKQKYAIVGKHSAVQICKWTKNALNKKGVCWKEKFYGLQTHRCCQCSPAVMWCDNSCVHCWRPIEMNLGNKLPEADNAKELLDNIIKARKELLMGFKGNKNVSKKKFEEALNPNMFTLSLSGEPTLYPYLPDLIKEIRKRKSISYLVTNGLHPDMLRRLEKENALPTQLTVSVNAPTPILFKQWHRSKQADAWKKFNETLTWMKEANTRTIFRMTLVKPGKEGLFKDMENMSEKYIPQYIKLIEKSDPQFIHIKGFKSLGWSRKRMGYDKQPMHY